MPRKPEPKTAPPLRRLLAETVLLSDNPFEAPRVEYEAVGVRSGRRADLAQVARYQRGVIVCILLQLACFLVTLVFPALGDGAGTGLLALGVGGAILVASLLGLAFVILLSCKVYPTWLGIMLGLMTLAPCLGLLVLLAINSRATRILRDNGIPVGLLGAKAKDILSS